MAQEGLKTTPNKLIHIGNPVPFDEDDFLQKLEGLMEAACAGSDDIKQRVAEVVDTYKPEGNQ